MEERFKTSIRFLSLAMVVIISLTSGHSIVEAAKINRAEQVQQYDELKRKEIGVGVEAGIYNLAGTQLKGLQYAGMMSLQDRMLWEEAINELMRDIEVKTNIDMRLFDKVEFTISPYRFNGLAGITHTTSNKHNVILTQDIKGIPNKEYRKQVMKETIAHELGHVIYNQVDIEDTYRMMVGNGGRRTITNNLNMSKEQWEYQIEENFAEDVKVYIINNIREKEATPAVKSTPKNNTRFSADRNDMGSLMQRSVGRPLPRQGAAPRMQSARKVKVVPNGQPVQPQRSSTRQVPTGQPRQAPQRQSQPRQAPQRPRPAVRQPNPVGIDGTINR